MLTSDTTSASAAFAAFFQEHRRRAERQAYLLCRDHHAAEDIAAEAFARMWRAWQTTDIDHPSSYLYRTVRNVAADRFRRAARERRTTARALPAEQLPEEPAVEARMVLRMVLPSLSDQQQRTLALRYLEDLSEAEVAAILEVPRGTLKSHTYRALHRLRALHQDVAA